MNKAKRSISIILTLLMLAFAIPNFAIASFAETLTFGDFTYEIKDETVTITGYNASNEKVEIPTEIDEKKVTTIGKEAFKGNEKIKTVVLPNTVTNIKTKAFALCKNLEEVKFNENVKSIGISAFYGTALYTVATNDNGETYINNCLIHVAKISNGKDIKEYTVKDGTRLIAQGAFYHDGLTYTSKDELVYPELKTITVPASVERINSYAFYSCNGLTQLKLNDGVKYIDKNAFEQCSALKSIVLPKTLESIASNTFDNCKALTTVTVNGKPKLNEAGFNNCPALKDVIFNEGIKEFNFGVFKDCPELEAVTIPASVTKFADAKADNCPKLNTIKGYKGSLAEEFANNNSYKFSSLGECPLVFDYEILEDNTISITKAYGVENTLVIPKSYDGYEVKAIKENAFNENDTVVDLYVSDDITIENGAFSNCTNLRTVILGENIIIDSSFNNCPSLEAVIIPKSVESIENSCFENDDKLVIYGETESFAESYANENLISFANINEAAAPTLYFEQLYKEIEKLEKIDLSLYVDESKASIEAEIDALKSLKETDATISEIENAIEKAEATIKAAEFIEILGDTNRDGKVSIIDAKWVLQQVAELRTLDEKSLSCADVNKDGKISIVDAKWILQIVSNLRDENGVIISNTAK